MTLKLYYSPAACSMSVHIALREANISFELVKVDLRTHTLKDGEDFTKISPRGYVPLIELEDGTRHTEAAALLQYVGDLDSTHTIFPKYGSRERFEVIKWLTFISTELHKVFSPWLWHKDTTAESTIEKCVQKLNIRFTELNQHLAKNAYLVGDHFTIADAYCFVIVNWSHYLQVDLSPYSNLTHYLTRISARPKVQAALEAEHLLKKGEEHSST